MRHATVKRRRTDPRHRPLVYVLCPWCHSAHWMPDAGIGRCPRKNGAAFSIRREPR
jgi:hypothetical protein